MIRIPEPELQINFAAALAQVRRLYLQGALSETVRALNITTIDQELAQHVPSKSLAALASHGLRGEMLFPVPQLLTANPRLLGYSAFCTATAKKSFTPQRQGSLVSKAWRRGAQSRQRSPKKSRASAPSSVRPARCCSPVSVRRKSAQRCSTT